MDTKLAMELRIGFYTFWVYKQMKKLLDNKKTNKNSTQINFFEGIITFVLWEGSLYIIDDDLGFVANAFLLVITYLIASKIIKNYFKR